MFSKQLLDNLLLERKYDEALRLALKLDQPKRTLDILQGEPVTAARWDTFSRK